MTLDIVACPAPPKVQVFDLRGEPVALEPREWSPRRRREPARLLGVVLHQWGSKVGTTGANRLRHGEPEALARRAPAAPYHVSCGVTRSGVPVVALAHPLERYTHASDAGNLSYISVGVMGLFPFEAEQRNPARHSPVTDVLRAAVDRALLEAALMLEAAQPGGGPWHLVTHRQCANGQDDHFACPGEDVVDMAVRSLVVTGGALVPDPDLVLLPEHGKPWPAAWRRCLRPAAAPTDTVVEASLLDEQVELS